MVRTFGFQPKNGVSITLGSSKYIKCSNCENLTKNKKFCSLECSQISQRKVVDRPSYNELKNNYLEFGYKKTGSIYGVADNTIKKWIKQYESIS